MPEINAEEIKKNAIKQQNNKKTAGNVTNVYFEYGAYLKILRFSKAGSIDGSRGILLGYKEGESGYVIAALEALYSGDDGLESPSFTKESWARILEEKKEFYENLSVIGQYATHPKSVPSSDDEAMQKTFFKENENILFVLDPIDNTESINVYTNGVYKKLDGIFLYDKTGAEIDLNLKNSITRTTDTEYEHRMRAFDKFSKRLSKYASRVAVVIIAMVLLIIYMMFQNIEMRRDLAQKEENMQAINRRCDNAEMSVINLKQELELIKEEIE